MAWQRGLPGWTGGTSKLCMVPFLSCYIYVTLKSKEVVRRVEIFKPSYVCVYVCVCVCLCVCVCVCVCVWKGGVGEGRGVQFLWDAVDHSRHHAYNLQPGNCSLVN